MMDRTAPSERAARFLEIEAYRRRIVEHKRYERNGVVAVWDQPLNMNEVFSLSRMEPKLIADREKILEDFRHTPITPEEERWLREQGCSTADLGLLAVAPIPESAPPPAAAGQADSLRVELDRERQRLAAEVKQLRDELKEEAKRAPAWTNHNTRLFKLLSVVIEEAAALPSWPKQEVLIPDLMARHNLTKAEAKAIDAVTRPDERRGK